MSVTRNALIFGLFAAAASPAAAHVDPVAHGSLAGIAHPFLGLDHVIAMVAVGLWAVAMGGRAMVALPGAFVGAMVAGFGLALWGVTLPVVEPMIAASVVALGVAVALAARLTCALALESLRFSAFSTAPPMAENWASPGPRPSPWALSSPPSRCIWRESDWVWRCPGRAGPFRLQGRPRQSWASRWPSADRRQRPR